MNKKYLLCDMSYWQSTYTQEKIKLLKDNGMMAIILRAGYGSFIDTLLPTLICYCKNLNIPFGLYFYLYPDVSFQTQVDLFVEIIKENPETKCVFLDFEEYKMVGGGIYSSSYLSAFYKNSYDALVKALPNMKIGIYSAQWCIDGHFPQVSSWIKPEFFWNAVYVKYYTWYQNFIKSLGGSWGDSSKLISVSNLPAIMEEVDKHWGEMQLPTGITGCMMWQFNSFFPFKELSAGQRNIDMNLAPASTLKEYFGLDLEVGGVMGKILDVAYVSQLGEGAGMHNNDCGPASCSMVLLASKDIFVSPDEFYKIDGWGAPNTDIGTTAYQLQKALGLFDVETSIGTSLTLSEIYSFIDESKPFIPLVSYKVLSDAGLTYKRGTFLHWLVVIGYDENNIIALDPYRPIESGGQISIPNQIFLNSYRSSYVACITSVEGGAMPIIYNSTVKASGGLNIRQTPGVPYGNLIGALSDKQRIFIESVSNGWGRLTVPKLGYVSMAYVVLDAPLPPPAGVDEKAVRLDEIKKLEAYIAGRKAEI